jgi:hypothetical protein
MNANKPAVITVHMRDVRALRLHDSGLETLRPVAGTDARPLGHDRGPGYAFLAVDATGRFTGLLRELTRSFVLLSDLNALVTYDIAAAGTLKWVLEGADGRENVSTVAATESASLHLIEMAKSQPAGKVESEDLAGLRLGGRVVLFHTETRMAQSAVSFDVAGPARLQFLVTGLAPGPWEVWRAGMLEIDDQVVAPAAGTLHFSGKPGSYFLRRG